MSKSAYSTEAANNWYRTYMGVINALDHIRTNIIDLDVLAGDWIADCPTVSSLGPISVVSLDLALAVLLRVLLGFDLGISLSLVLVQACHELLDVGNPIGARIVASGPRVFLLLHPA